MVVVVALPSLRPVGPPGVKAAVLAPAPTRPPSAVGTPFHSPRRPGLPEDAAPTGAATPSGDVGAVVGGVAPGAGPPPLGPRETTVFRPPPAGGVTPPGLRPSLTFSLLARIVGRLPRPCARPGAATVTSIRQGEIGGRPLSLAPFRGGLVPRRRVAFLAGEGVAFHVPLRPQAPVVPRPQNRLEAALAAPRRSGRP